MKGLQKVAAALEKAPGSSPVSDPRPFWDLVDKTAVWVGADGEAETFPVAVLGGCKGRPLPEIVSIVELGIQIGEVVTIDGKPLGPGSNIHLTVNGIDL